MRFLFLVLIASHGGGGLPVNYLQRIFVIGLGGLLAAALYFNLAMGNSQIISHHGFNLVAIIGLISVPASLVAMNMGKRNVWTAIWGVLIAVVMFCWLFVVSFGAGLPGSEWIGVEMVNAILFLPLATSIILIVRLPDAMAMFGISVLFSFIALMFSLQIVMRQALEKQVVSTLNSGGCIVTGRASKKTVKSAKEINFGLFIGPRSDQVYFVEGEKYFRWSYSNFGIDTRRGVPKSFPLTNDLSCKA
jgi:hypothetical protein